MRYRLLFVGRKARDPLLEANRTYLDRLGHYARVELIRIKEGGLAAERDQLLAKLGARNADTVVVALDEHGDELTTVQLTEQLRRWIEAGQQNITFVVGGADGLDEAVKARADALWALSRFTLPHRLAQVVLTEQLYRAHTILRGERYHRA